MKGYAIGQKCVITWATNPANIGRVVTINSAPFVAKTGSLAPCGRPMRTKCCDGMVCQEMLGATTGWISPVAWLSPLSDPDQITEPTEQEIEA